MRTERLFTAKEIAQAAQEALENWDFDVIEESEEYVASYKAALDISEADATELWCEDGPMDLDSAYQDIWDFLDEYAKCIAAY